MTLLSFDDHGSLAKLQAGIPCCRDSVHAARSALDLNLSVGEESLKLTPGAPSCNQALVRDGHWPTCIVCS